MIGVRHSFDEGTLVRHKHHGYRGVVVAFDVCCRADDTWYEGNRTRPDRNQPWYHVLVDGGAHATYAAQENLERDPSDRRVEHPLVPRFFRGFLHGAYERNDEPWPGWD